MNNFIDLQMRIRLLTICSEIISFLEQGQSQFNDSNDPDSDWIKAYSIIIDYIDEMAGDI